MKKIMILTILTLSMAMVGCKGNANNNIAKEPVTNTENSVKVDSNTNNTIEKESIKATTNDSSKAEIQSRKQEFKNKLDKIEKDLDASEERKKSDEGTTFAMRVYAGKQYTEWDKVLNEIYGVLKQQLSADDMKKLETEESKWIKEKEARAEKAGKEMEGGTMEPVLRTGAAAKATKERCYELVDKYMK